MMINFLEKRGPTLSAIVGGVTALAATWLLETTSVPAPLIATAATFGVVLAGFSATQRNMLFPIRISRVIRRAIQINQMDRILSYLSRSSYIGIVITLYSFIGFFVGDHFLVVRAWMAVLIALVFFALACLARNEMVMSLIMKRYMEEHPEQASPYPQTIPAGTAHSPSPKGAHTSPL